ncbi:hypothetical protein [Winogradskya consettensis]|nr:hypothetical protein [Actinoplanes consettensis]
MRSTATGDEHAVLRLMTGEPWHDSGLPITDDPRRSRFERRLEMIITS